MTVSLTNLFLTKSRGLTLSDGGGVTWSINKNTNAITATVATNGTVTSVGLSDASGTPIYTVGSTPVTTTGTISLTLKTQNANLVFCGPVSGGAAQPTFRALAAADLTAALLPATGLRADFQTASVSTSGANDVYRFLTSAGAVSNNSVGGIFDVIAEDHSTGANQTVYQLWIGSTSNGTTNATLIQLQRLLRGTDPGTSSTPFSLANDGVGGAVKLQFTKNASISQVDLKIAFRGVSST